jgi:hypothetical protein
VLFCNYTAAGDDTGKTSLVFTQIPVDKNEEESSKGFYFQCTPPEGSRIVLLEPARPGGKLKVLTKKFYSACDPCVSYDGDMLLFAARKTRNDGWDIWEMEINGGKPRRITENLGDCREPVYLAKSSITPPEFDDKVRWITYTSTAAGSYDESGGEKATSLYVTNLEPIEGRGTVVWRATFNLSSDFSPTVLSDGRILFSSWQHHGIRYFPHGKIALMTINWAGTGLNLFYGNHQGESVKTMSCEMLDRTLVFIESDGSSYDGSGRLARVSFKRPLHSHEILSRGDGRYQTPHPFSDGRLAVSYTSGIGSFGVYFFDFENNMPGEMIFDDPAWDEIDPVEVAPRDEPTGRITIVVDSRETGHLQCLNVYDSDRPEAGSINVGDVKRVRFVEGLPLTPKARSSLPESVFRASESAPSLLPAACFTGTRVLGESLVEADGSFLVELPADTPFFIQTLDENGMALLTMRGWMWVRRGIRRGCVGCHENKELSPVNRTTDALRKSTPVSLITPPEKRRSVDFKHDILPVIERRCMKCHGTRSAGGGLFLGESPSGDHFTAFESLLALDPEKVPDPGNALVHPGSARTSRLIHMLNGWGDYSSGRGMPHDKLLDGEELRIFVEWIDLGAHWDNACFTAE